MYVYTHVCIFIVCVNTHINISTSVYTHCTHTYVYKHVLRVFLKMARIPTHTSSHFGGFSAKLKIKKKLNTVLFGGFSSKL